MSDYIVYRISLAIILTTLSILLPPLLDGIERKIKARIHSRIGPPILQTWFDLAKLFGKDFVIPKNMPYLLPLIILLFILQVFVIVAFFVYSLWIDVVNSLFIIIALSMITQAVFVAIPFITVNPFAIVGASREIVLALVNEVFFVIGIGLLSYVLGVTEISGFTATANVFSNHMVSTSILLTLLFLLSYTVSSRIPYDIAEAEPELASGILIELSGPLLALYLYSLYLKRYFVKIIPIFILLSMILGDLLYSAVYSVAGVILVWVIYGVIEAILARSRVDVAPMTLTKIYILFTFAFAISYTVGV